jgi:hypothetical protein
MMVALAGTAFAANSLNNGAAAISVGMGDSIFSNTAFPMVAAMVNNVVDIKGRFFIAKDMALYGGFGLQTDGGDADGTYIGLSVGMRKYLKTTDFAPFVAGQLSIASVDDGAAKLSIFDLAALFGAEVFLAQQFSLEGAIGFGLGQAKENPGTGSVTDTYFGTRTVGVKANFYF